MLGIHDGHGPSPVKAPSFDAGARPVGLAADYASGA